MSYIDRIYKAPWKSRHYLDWVKNELECCASGMPADDPHHLKIPLLGGAKVDDIFVIPLTRFEHEKLHHDRRAWEARNLDQRDYFIKTIQRAFRAGVLDWKG